MTRISRRKLIAAGLASSLGITAYKFIKNQYIFSTDVDYYLASGFLLDEKNKFGLACCNLNTRDWMTFPVSTRIHSLLQSPEDPMSLLGIGRRGFNRSSIVSINSRREKLSIQAESGIEFYGHALLGKDPGTILVTEVQGNNYSGRLTLRKTKDLSLIKVIDIDWRKPHQMAYSSDKKLIAIACAGAKEHRANNQSMGRILLLEANNFEVIGEHQYFENLVKFSHLASMPNDCFLIVTESMNSSVTIPPNHLLELDLSQSNPKLVPYSAPTLERRKMGGYCLSIVIDGVHQQAIVTHGAQQVVSFWSLREKRLLKLLDFNEPQGISICPITSHYIITANNRFLYFVDPKSLKVTDQREVPQIKHGRWCSHSLTFAST